MEAAAVVAAAAAALRVTAFAAAALNAAPPPAPATPPTTEAARRAAAAAAAPAGPAADATALAAVAAADQAAECPLCRADTPCRCSLRAAEAHSTLQKSSPSSRNHPPASSSREAARCGAVGAGTRPLVSQPEPLSRLSLSAAREGSAAASPPGADCRAAEAESGTGGRMQPAAALAGWLPVTNGGRPPKPPLCGSDDGAGPSSQYDTSMSCGERTPRTEQSASHKQTIALQRHSVADSPWQEGSSRRTLTKASSVRHSSSTRTTTLAGAAAGALVSGPPPEAQAPSRWTVGMTWTSVIRTGPVRCSVTCPRKHTHTETICREEMGLCLRLVASNADLLSGCEVGVEG